MPIKLKDIYEAGATGSWARFVQLRLPADLAYKILGYARKVEAEIKDVFAVHSRILREVAGVDENTEPKIEEDSEEGKKFQKLFVEFLEGDSTLEPCELKRQAVLDAIQKNVNNQISPHDIACLDIFFVE